MRTRRIRMRTTVLAGALFAIGCAAGSTEAPGSSGDAGSGGAAGSAGGATAGASGTGGAAGGNSGQAGSAGKGGTAGSAGSAGSGGAAGNAGSAGSGGAAGNAGSAGSGGAAGNAGSAGSGGAAGNAGSAGSGGAAGNAGSAGSGGAAGNAGSAGSGGAAGSAGAAGSGGNPNPNAPGAVTSFRTTPTDAAVYASWKPPTDADYAGIVLLERTGGAVTSRPVDHHTYTVGEAVGPHGAKVAYVGAANNKYLSPRTNLTTYHYAAFAYDNTTLYSAAALNQARPLNPMPSTMKDYKIGTMGSDVLRYAFVLDSNDHPHVAMIVSESTEKHVYYATCTGSCTSASDWWSVLVDTHANSNRNVGITLDSSGRPRITFARTGPYVTTYAYCDSDCTNTHNWSALDLPGTSGGYGVIRTDPTGRIWIVGPGADIELSTCDHVCGNVANWSLKKLPRKSTYVFDLQFQGTQAVIMSNYYSSHYYTEMWSCSNSCLEPSNWASTKVANTSGSWGPAYYRFVPETSGARVLSVYDKRYRSCDTCAPGLPPSTRVLSTTEIYSGGYFEASDKGQPRVLSTRSNGHATYSVCDLDCDSTTGWTSQELLQNSNRGLAFQLDSGGLPIVLYKPYSSSDKMLHMLR